MDHGQIAMEITKTIIEKGKLNLATHVDTTPQDHNEFVGNEVAKLYKTIFKAVNEPLD